MWFGYLMGLILHSCLEKKLRYKLLWLHYFNTFLRRAKLLLKSTFLEVYSGEDGRLH